MITAAISVLSAIEGIGIATPALNRFVLPLAIAVLLALFLFQKGGTGRVGRLFGPVMLFTIIAVIGVLQIAAAPRVLAALNPAHAVGIFVAFKKRCHAHGGPTVRISLPPAANLVRT
jgi:KUP system potassium uptake protein